VNRGFEPESSGAISGVTDALSVGTLENYHTPPQADCDAAHCAGANSCKIHRDAKTERMLFLQAQVSLRILFPNYGTGRLR
jgi:hypothetical protein